MYTMAYWILYISVIAAFLKQGTSQITTNGCGTTKGCFKNPSSCTDSTDCEFLASWVYDADNSKVNFQISAKATSFVALGLSKSGNMGDSDVYACTKNSEVVRSRNGMAYFSNMPQPLKGVSDVAVTVMDGRIECSFTREVSLNDNDDTFYDLTGSNEYTVIMSRSDADLMSDGNIVAHAPLDPPTGGRIKDSAPVSFVQYMNPVGNDMTTPTAMNPMNNDATTPTAMQGVDTKSQLTSGCGTTKGCFRQPADCTTACHFFVSWTADQAKNNVFRITGTNSGSYIALGFSKSGKMRDSDVYACTKNMEVVRSRNTVVNNNVISTLKGVSDVTISVVGGRIDCTFTRQASLNDNDETYYDLSANNSYFIIMAKSSAELRGDGSIDYHYDGRIEGSEKTSFQQFTETVGEVDTLGPILQKTHGSLMVAAWVLFASVGITLARFYKKMWPETRLCGKAVWFTIHRMCMTLTFLCTVAAFVIIFIHKKGFVELNEGLSGLLRFLHALLGTLVTFLVILNPIMALFRPKPDAPRRWLFNWAHWAVGTGAHLIGMATICLGLGYRAAVPLINGLPLHIFWVMIVFIGFHIVMWVLLQIQGCMEVQKGDKNNIPLHDDATTFQEQLIEDDVQRPLGSGTMNMLLFIYLLGVVIAAAFIIITIATVGLSA